MEGRVQFVQFVLSLDSKKGKGNTYQMENGIRRIFRNIYHNLRA